MALQDPYDKSADVFSYGMVLYELLTRKKPPPRKLRDGYAFDLSLKVSSVFLFLLLLLFTCYPFVGNSPSRHTGDLMGPVG